MYPVFTCVDPDLYSEYGSGSTKLLNTGSNLGPNPQYSSGTTYPGPLGLGIEEGVLSLGQEVLLAGHDDPGPGGGGHDAGGGGAPARQPINQSII